MSPTPLEPARRLLGQAAGVATAVREPAAAAAASLAPGHWSALAGALSRRAAAGPGAWVVDGVAAAGVLRRAGLIAPIRPDRLVGVALAMRYGPSVAAGMTACAARNPRGTALIDDEGLLTFGEIAARTDALAAAYALRGIGSGTAVGLLARNGRAFLEPMVALGKVGADVVLLNTGMAPPALAEVVRRERLVAAVADDDLADLLPPGLVRLGAHVEPLGRAEVPRTPKRPGRIVLLTSGTTGTPKGAARSVHSAAPGIALLEAIPYRSGEPLLIASPLFHAWGLANLGLALLLGSPMVLRSRFDPATVLADVETHRVCMVAAVPVMLQRLVALDPAVRARYDTTSLRGVSISGSALPATLAKAFQDAFGDVIYNLYGSTEVGFATVATPADLRADPGTAGRPLRGVTVRIVDEAGQEVPTGRSGRIFVGSDLAFEGYTGGEDKVRLEGLVSSGDTGRYDDTGRLQIEGRDDDMIISGGENVFPGEVEDVIAALGGVGEVAVVGVPDEDFGQRLVAFVVVAGGSELDVETVRGHVRAHLASYKVPREVSFIDELPRNATGKVLRRDLVRAAL